MLIRLLALCVALLGAALGVVGCSSAPLPPVSGGSAPASPGASSTVKPPTGKPTGTVTVKSDGKVVCVITLDKNGTGTCKVSTANLQPGKVTYTGIYSGDKQYNGSDGSTTVTLMPGPKQT